jgi:acetylornithine deacetylase/succinyl-diaminopimelate desuccinylase family protein
MVSEEEYVTGVLRGLVQVSSINPPGIEREIAEGIITILHDIGISSNLEIINEKRANVVGVIKGRNHGPVLVLNGHLDTVAVREDWNYPPFEGKIIGNRMYGLGTSDMKGGIASMITAARRLKEDNVKLNGTLILSFVADEENHNAGTLKFLEDYENIDYAVIGEPTNLNVVVSNRGIMRFRITTFGKAGHSSNPALGRNAIYMMNEIIRSLMELADSYCKNRETYFTKPSLSVSMITGGTAENVIPDRCEIVIDRRTVSGENSMDVENEIMNLLREIERENDSFICTCEPFVAVEAWKVKRDSKLLKFGEKVYQKCFQKEPEFTDLGATCEAPLFAQRGIDTLVFGPGSIKQAHTRDEYIEIRQLMQASEYYYMLIREILS